MSDKGRLQVVLCWHMHQPEYRDLSTGEYQLPWTYLHAIKDYVDMAAHIERVPRARAVVNFVPILLEQIDDYARQVKAYMDTKQGIRDPLLHALVNPALPADYGLRRHLIKACLRVNRRTVIERFPIYLKLAKMADWLEQHTEAAEYLSEQYLIDLVVWYHLGWLGEHVRRTDERARLLMEKGGHFSMHDRLQLMAVISDVLSGLLGRYRRLAEGGKIELAMTPYAHPIAPLLLSIESAREAWPEVKLPLLDRYPGGEERVRRHIVHGQLVFEKFFGIKPRGCWPAEGGVSTQTLKLLDEHGFHWTATGAGVLGNTLHQGGAGSEHATTQGVHQAYHVDGQKIQCFFRDDGLSDLIGFTYSGWHADDAVSNLVHHLENIADACKNEPGCVASIILDGENAWEYYPENGYYFLDALYRRLSEHPRLKLTTFSECVSKKVKTTRLSRIVAGSWVYGTFSTWIGDNDKNRGWEMLGDAKRCFDRVVASGRLSREQLDAAEQQLFICEGSDWFWWFGDYNPADSVSDFERLYRQHLTHLYMLLGEEPPDYLAHSFTHGGGAPAMGGAMRPGQAG